jgi:hypothetical protein
MRLGLLSMRRLLTGEGGVVAEEALVTEEPT